ncbi:MAG: hypothetical protein IPG50_20525 [Myxococcales bacterium]|nr:hypothetical protein [Myxococcales bacterium]
MRPTYVALTAGVALLSSCMFFRSLSDLSSESGGGVGPAGEDAAKATDARPAVDGSADAPTTPWPDAGSDGPAVLLGGPSLCDAGTWLLCDGFEGASLGAPWYTPPTAFPDTARAARGAGALHVHLDAGVTSAPSYVAAPIAFAKPWQSTFARVFLYAPGGQPLPNTGMLYFYFNGAGYPGADVASLGDGRFLLRAPPNYAGAPSALAIPRDRWACLEMEIAPDDAGIGTVRAWLDTEPFDVSLGGVPTTQIDTLQVGVQATTTANLDLWFDEIAVDTKRIGCAR